MAAPWWVAWLGFVVLCIGSGFLSSLAGIQGQTYAELVRPSWAPPGWLFAPVWTTLYTLMGTAAYLVWRHRTSRQRRTALVLFGVQLALNVAWTPVFFGLHQIFAAFALIIAIWLAVTAMMLAFARLDRLAGGLLVPLWLWVGFATLLNGAIWWSNR